MRTNDQFESEIATMLRRRAHDIDENAIDRPTLRTAPAPRVATPSRPSAGADLGAPTYLAPFAETTSHRRRWPSVAAICVVVGAAVAGLQAMGEPTQPGVSSGADGTPPGAVGDEVPLEVVNEPLNHVVGPGLVLEAGGVRAEVGSDLPGRLSLSETYAGTEVDTTSYRCIMVQHSEGGGGGCGPRDPGAEPQVGGLLMAGGHVHWKNVPDDAAIVTYRIGTYEVWQRPVDGVVVFPSPISPEELYVLRAIDDQGHVLVETSNEKEWSPPAG